MAAAVGVSVPADGQGNTRATREIAWTENLNGALARAGTELRPVLLVFSSPECPWCVRLRTETLAEEEVAAVLEGFICVTVDTSRDPKTAQAFQIRGVPATVILSGDGRAQSFAEGFMDKRSFLAFLEAYRTGGGRGGTAQAALEGWLKVLREGEVAAAQWPEMMAGLGVKENRARLHRALLAYEPCPRREWIGLLRHPRLAVRLGALELLEELAGEPFGYDPWCDAAANSGALERWRQWSEGETNGTRQVYAPLTEEQIAAYIRDLASRDRVRSARAVRMLEQAGEPVIPVLEAWASANGEAGEEVLRHVREVRTFLMLPDSLGAERGRIAHRLVFGNQDDRLRSLGAAAAGGERALPVLSGFLADPDPLVRETAVDSLYAAGRARACPLLKELLATEKDEEVIHAVIRGAGGLKGAQAVELAGPFLTHGNEDLVVAALASLGRTKSVKAAAAVRGCLKHPQWRVRAAALEALGKMGDRSAEEEVAACLEDADPFVRRTAVLTLAELSAKKSAKRLSEIFLKDDPLKGPILTALRKMKVPVPDSFGPALKGKDDEVILSVLDGLGDGSGEAWRLALPFVRHGNGDIACAAIRIVAGEGGRDEGVLAELAAVLRDGAKERVLAVFGAYPPEGDAANDVFELSESVNDLFESLVGGGTAGDAGRKQEGDGALADLFAAFAPQPAAAPPAASDAAPREQPGLLDVFAAFGAGDAGKGAAAGGSAPEEAAPSKGREVIRGLATGYLEARHAPELRSAAAQMLLAMGDAGGIAYLLEAFGSLTVEERLSAAKRAERCRGGAAVELVKRLLRDPSADVRRPAVSLCLNQPADGLAAELLAALCEPGAALVPRELFEKGYAWYRAMNSRAVRRTFGAAARRILEAEDGTRHGDGLRIAALVLLEACWQEGDQALAERYLESGNPFVRRAAWYAFGKPQPKAFAAQAERVAKDTSEWVRAVLPAVYGRDHTPDWKVYFDAETATDGIRRFRMSSGGRAKLPGQAVEALTALCRDPVEHVRCAAAMCLFENRENVEAALLVRLLETSGEKTSLADRFRRMLTDAPAGWLREQNNGDMLALIDAVAARVDEDDAEKLGELRKKLAGDDAAQTGREPAVAARRPAAGRAARGEAEQAVAEGAAETGAARRLVVFFRNPGCRDCDRVEAMLKALSAEFGDLSVEVLDIRDPEHARMNEVLCGRFGVEEASRLTAPAVFCGAGQLTRNEITFERLGSLLSRTEALETAWREVGREAAARADQELGERYSAMGPWLVFGAGLLDGVNPCAFATLIFLLSYLQLTRRGPREILAVGGMFVAGVFLAYFALGLGLVELVVRFSLLRRFGTVLNWVMAVFVAGVALLNVWDGVLCLRGRIGDMVLQLPRVLKSRIHDVVDASSRHRHFVAAAFAAGVVIAVLELACTGQVYAPTLLYMLKTGQGRWGAVAYLGLYNVAFVTPLAAVFVCAYGGMRSERLTLWLRRHAALVKFATALLFGALFAVFVTGIQR
jgi:HEAT repeat protein/cytochrome c biogenesis protein CcdA/thiol-disulfide isomerase/thioredoxin